MVDFERAGTIPTRAELRRVIGGPVEVILLDGRQGLALVCGKDGEGPRNKAASNLVKREIHGPAIVLAQRLLLC